MNGFRFFNLENKSIFRILSGYISLCYEICFLLCVVSEVCQLLTYADALYFSTVAPSLGSRSPSPGSRLASLGSRSPSTWFSFTVTRFSFSVTFFSFTVSGFQESSHFHCYRSRFHCQIFYILYPCFRQTEIIISCCHKQSNL